METNFGFGAAPELCNREETLMSGLLAMSNVSGRK
jgi:hypothetical protein